MPTSKTCSRSAYDLEEPAATEQAAVGGDSARGTSDRFGHCFTIERVQECLTDKVLATDEFEEKSTAEGRV